MYRIAIRLYLTSMIEQPVQDSVKRKDEPKREALETVRLRDIVLVPNLLSLMRLVFGVPAVWLILESNSEQSDHIAAGLLVLSFISDWFDGFFARLLHQQSALGLILDPVMDKLIVISVAVAISVADHIQFPVVVVGAIVLRDLTILVLAAISLAENRHLFASRWVGKVTMFIVSATLLAMLIDDWLPGWLTETLPWVTFVLLLLSSVDYLGVYLRIQKNHGQDENSSDS